MRGSLKRIATSAPSGLLARLAWNVGAALSLLHGTVYGGGESSASLSARLGRVNAATALDAAGVAPWHVKMSVQLFDEKGRPGEQGLYEEWWGGAEADRIVYAMPSYKATEVQTSAGFFRSTGAEPPPLVLELLRDQVVHPMPAQRDLEGTTPELRKEKFGKAALECVMLGRPINAAAYVPTGLFPTYCMEPGRDSLRVSYDFGSQAILRNDVQEFQGRAVGREIAIQRAGVAVATGRIFKLETVGQDATPGADMQGLQLQPGRAVRVGAATMSGLLLTKLSPVYPDAARQQERGGTVIVQLVVGLEGHVEFARVVSAPYPDLGDAALAAVKQLSYKPYMVNGKPVIVETTTVVNFVWGAR